LVKDAIAVVSRSLSALPHGAAADDLRVKAEMHRVEAEGWKVGALTALELQRLMKSVLALHLEVTRLERACPPVD
jgi:hypothetical protein